MFYACIEYNQIFIIVLIPGKPFVCIRNWKPFLFKLQNLALHYGTSLNVGSYCSPTPKMVYLDGLGSLEPEWPLLS